jgi:hypothetical protein
VLPKNCWISHHPGLIDFAGFKARRLDRRNRFIRVERHRYTLIDLTALD